MLGATVGVNDHFAYGYDNGIRRASAGHSKMHRCKDCRNLFFVSVAADEAIWPPCPECGSRNITTKLD